MPEPRPIGTNTTSGTSPARASPRRTRASRSRRRAPGRRGTTAPCAARARGERRGVLARGLEVVAVLDQLGAERAHRGVLLDRVAVRHDDRRRARRARCAANAIDWPWLPRVALTTPRSPGSRAQQRVEVDQPAAQLERADRRVVLVLDPRPARRARASSSGQRCCGVGGMAARGGRASAASVRVVGCDSAFDGAMRAVRRRAPMRSQRHAPFDADHRLPADPGVGADAIDVDAAGAAERRALARDVVRRRQPGADQPLGEAGVEAAGDRVLRRAERRHEGAHLELHRRRRRRPRPRRDDAELEAAASPSKSGSSASTVGARAEQHGDPARAVVDPLRGAHRRRRRCAGCAAT